jgi:hypothetical protein
VKSSVAHLRTKRELERERLKANKRRATSGEMPTFELAMIVVALELEDEESNLIRIFSGARK